MAQVAQKLANFRRCVVRGKDGGESKATNKIRDMVVDRFALKGQLETAKSELDKINAALIETVGAGNTVVLEGECRVTIFDRETVKIEEADGHALSALLGDRAGDLLAVKTVFKPQPKLVEIASDGDDPLSGAVRKRMAVVCSQVATWRAEKAAT